MKHTDQSKALSRQALANLRAIVERHGITHESLADELDIRRQTVGQVLGARFHPTLDNVFRFLEVVNELTEGNYSLRDIDPNEAALNWRPISVPPSKDNWQLLGWVNVGNGSVAYVVSYMDGVWGGVPQSCTITHWCEISGPSYIDLNETVSVFDR